ncbi:MAG: universal stress protein [Spirochaeta sp.]
MFTKAVVATDLSPASHSLVEGTNWLKDLGVSEIVLVHCFGAVEASSFAFARESIEYERLLEEQGARIRANGFTVTVRDYTGSPQHGIQTVATETGADLIVVGSHGHAIRSGMHLGGRAWGIIHHAVRPVLVLRLEPHDEQGARLIETGAGRMTDSLLFATDFSETANRSIPFLERLIDKGTSRVTIAHIQDQMIIDPYLLDKRDEFMQIDNERLSALQERIKLSGPQRIDVELGYGKPSMELIRLTETVNPSLLIMGTQGKGLVRELLMGSVSHTVTSHTRCPVLLIPPETRA